MTAAERKLRSKIKRGALLSRQIKHLDGKKAELDALKAEFRELAGKKDLRLETPDGASVSVEHKDDAAVRVVPNELMAKVRALAGEKLFSLFTLHPSIGDAQNFELNLLRTLPKVDGERLAKLLTAPVTPWVKFRS